jgi:Flp pilus assembly CpaE family ATPase
MYPLKVILVGAMEAVLPQLRKALHDNPAVTEAEFLKVSDAIDNYRWVQDETRLLVMAVRSFQDVEDLQKLKRTFTAWPILALVDFSRNGGSNLLLLANRAGASQVVPLPLDNEDFRAAMEAIGKDFGYAAANAKVLAVCGVTGGCGATTLTLNLAAEMTHLEKVRSIAVELAYQRGTLATYLNVEPQYVIPDLLSAEGKLDMHMVEKALTRAAENFYILSGAHDKISRLEVQPRDVQRLLDYLRRLAQVLVLDVPCTLDELFLQTLAAADQVVFVAEPNPASLRSLHLVLEMLNQAGDGRGDYPVYVVLNRYDSRNSDVEPRRIQELLRVRRLYTVGNDYTAIRAALNCGQTLRAGPAVQGPGRHRPPGPHPLQRRRTRRWQLEAVQPTRPHVRHGLLTLLRQSNPSHHLLQSMPDS